MEENPSEIRGGPSGAQDRGPEGRASGKWSIRERARDVFAGLCGRVRALVGFALAFELLRFLVLAPLVAGVLRLALERWGRCSVGNFEVLAFLLSPPGVVALVAAGAITLTSFYLQIGGLLLLLADRDCTLGGAAIRLGRRTFRLFVLGLRQLVVLTALAAPFIGAVAVAVREEDIMLTLQKQRAAIFVDRSCPQWIVRDPKGDFWLVPSVESPWDHRRPFQPTEQTDLEPVPGHYGDMLGLPF